MKVISMFKKEAVIPVTIAATVALFLVVSLVQATTTISTDITTEGALTVGTTASLAHATSTLFTNSGLSWLNGDVNVNGFATTTALSGSFATAGNTTVIGTASSTKLIVGNDSVSTINGLIYGFCTAAFSVNASSTTFADCTGATGVTSNYKVFLQATSSLPDQVILQSASSTATAGTINIKLFNTGILGGGTGSITRSFNFWAVR